MGKREKARARAEAPPRRPTHSASMEAQGYILATEAAALTERSARTIHNWIRSGKVEGARDGWAWWVKRDSLAAFLGPEVARAYGLVA